ncbi:MAG: HEPN domain-containing protein [Saprospiraceae bacterium]|jgi:uncharacterized protein (UPF0332 family)|nr:HEPN domain-containing protein [Candidatus Defluviibacterium haderslevense]MBK7243618.1 HEPN domain-containing protein [Candidatus Defluviibacterium haderslevense]
MSDFQLDYIKYRVEKSNQAYKDAVILFENDSWNACVNRLYYSCYYVVSAVLQKNGVMTQTHSGLKSQFNLHFVKTGLISIEFGKLFSDLMDWRQKGDYGDMYDFNKESVEPLLVPVKEFIQNLKEIIER